MPLTTLTDHLEIAVMARSDIARWTGVMLALTASLVISPSGTAHLARQVQRETATRARWLAAVVLRRRSAPEPVAAPSSSGTTINVSGVWTLEASPDVTGAPLQEQITDLRRQVDGLWSSHAEMQQQHRSVTESLAAERARIAELDARADRIEQRLQQAQQAADATSARATPLVGLGVVLTGIPGEVASVVVIWVVVEVIALGFIVMLALPGVGHVRAAWRAGR